MKAVFRTKKAANRYRARDYRPKRDLISTKTGSNIGQNGILMGTAYISESHALKKVNAETTGRYAVSFD